MAREGNWYDLRVYVGNIGRYNEGSLVGGWATLPMGRDDLDAFLRDRVGIDGERYEEYRIDDFDLPDWLPAGPGERVVDERTSLEDLNVMAGVLSTLDEDDAAKARIWIEEGMSPAGRLSPLVFANVALQADDIPFYAYEAGTRFDPGISSNEEAFALTAAENDPELAEALDGRFGPYLVPDAEYEFELKGMMQFGGTYAEPSYEVRDGKLYTTKLIEDKAVHKTVYIKAIHKESRNSYEKKFDLQLSTSGIDEVLAEDVKIYPVPATDVLTIEVPYAEGKYAIYNVAGMALQSGEIDDNVTTVDVSNLSKVNFSSMADYEDFLIWGTDNKDQFI